MPNDVHYPIADADQTEAIDSVCRIYEASIPASERKPVEAIRAMARRPDYRLPTAVSDGRILGFASVFAPPGESFALLEYLAVDAAARGAGVGSGLFRAAVEATGGGGAAAGARWMLLEVDADVSDDAADLHERRRRQAFYRRLGCRRVAGMAYELPLHTSGGPPPPMHLFVHGVPGGVTPSRADLGHALRVIYPQVYGQPAGDTRIDRMLAAVPDPVAFD